MSAYTSSPLLRRRLEPVCIQRKTYLQCLRMSNTTTNKRKNKTSSSSVWSENVPLIQSSSSVVVGSNSLSPYNSVLSEESSELSQKQRRRSSKKVDDYKNVPIDDRVRSGVDGTAVSGKVGEDFREGKGRDEKLKWPEKWNTVTNRFENGKSSRSVSPFLGPAKLESEVHESASCPTELSTDSNHQSNLPGVDPLSLTAPAWLSPSKSNNSLTPTESRQRLTPSSANSSESEEESKVYVPQSVRAALPLPSDGLRSENSQPAGYDKALQDDFCMRFGLTEFVLQSYRCALSRKILLQGRLYVSQNYIGFFSLFNDATVFGGDTTVLFPLSHVVAMRKRVNAIFFDNSIEFELTDGATYFFATFLNRDKTFDFIHSLCEIHRKMSAAGVSGSSGSFSAMPRLSSTPPISSIELVGGSEPLTPTPKMASVLTKREAQECIPYHNGFYDIEYEIKKCDAPLPRVSLKNTEPGLVWNVPIRDVFDAVFANFHASSNPYTRILQAHNAAHYGVPPAWSPPPPAPFGPSSPGEYLPRRALSFEMDFKQSTLTRMLRFPTRGRAQEAFMLYVTSPRCFIVESRMQLSGIPLCDCFATRSRFRATALSPFETQLDGEFEVEFLKSTMLAGRIESETMSQLRENMKNFLKLSTECLLLRLDVSMDKPVPTISPSSSSSSSSSSLSAVASPTSLVEASDSSSASTLFKPYTLPRAMSSVSWMSNMMWGLMEDLFSVVTNNFSRLDFKFVTYCMLFLLFFLTWTCFATWKQLADLGRRVDELEAHRGR